MGENRCLFKPKKCITLLVIIPFRCSDKQLCDKLGKFEENGFDSKSDMIRDALKKVYLRKESKKKGEFVETFE